MNQANWMAVLALPMLALSLGGSGCAMDTAEEIRSASESITTNPSKAEPNDIVGEDSAEGSTHRTTYAWESLGTVQCVPGCRGVNCPCADPPCLGTPVVNAPCTPSGRICQVRAASGLQATRYFCH